MTIGLKAAFHTQIGVANILTSLGTLGLQILAAGRLPRNITDRGIMSFDFCLYILLLKFGFSYNLEEGTKDMPLEWCELGERIFKISGSGADVKQERLVLETWEDMQATVKAGYPPFRYPGYQALYAKVEELATKLDL